MYMNEELFIDFLSHKEILWTGINFSKAHFTKKGFDFSQEIMQHYLHDWNLLILNDQKKYDIRMSFRKPMMQYDLSLTTKINKGLRVNHLLAQHIDIKDVLSDEQVVEYFSSLEYPTTSKYALTFLVESFDDSTKMAAIWVVILETESRSVVLCENFLILRGGFGTRIYWARTFYNLLFDIKSSSFLRWENMVQSQIDASQDESSPVILG
ncbi:MAG: hypothetical protein MJZ57_00105 [Bacteroidales bacterium]|nr:hypothetical protein [Bacteroidales bacterium]